MMLTRCPGCTTTFRVTPEQVKVRHGKVRCGRCQNVFDAIEYLVDAPVPAPASAATPPAAEPHVAVTAAAPAPTPAPSTEPPVEVSSPAEAAAAPAVPAPAPVAADEPAENPPPDEAPPALLPRPLPDALALDALTQPPAQDEDDILLQPSPLSTDYSQAKTASQAGWPWTIAATLVFLVLIAQLMLAFRVDLAVKYPGVRPLLDMLCEQAHCTVELPSDPDSVSIEASDLHPAKKGGLELTATLRNRAPHAQAWPHLELTLTDGADKPIVRKVITPEQYLSATQSETDGFAANGEQAVQLLLDAGNLPAAGYRLYLFYP